VYQKNGLASAGRIPVGGMPHGLRSAAYASVIVVVKMMDEALDRPRPP